MLRQPTNKKKKEFHLLSHNNNGLGKISTNFVGQYEYKYLKHLKLIITSIAKFLSMPIDKTFSINNITKKNTVYISQVVKLLSQKKRESVIFIDCEMHK